MKRKTLAILPLAAAVLLGGCLQKETTHTLFLAPDGAVAWMALEKDVRSDTGNAADRRAEEQAYLASAASGRHGVALGLAALDPAARKTRVLRAERPFVVVTEARFSRVDALFERVLADLRVPGYAMLKRTGGGVTLLIHMDVAAWMADTPGHSTPVIDLIEEAARYRIVLTDGRFTAAQGFTLSDDGVTATPIEMSKDDVSALGGVVELSLTWSR